MRAPEVAEDFARLFSARPRLFCAPGRVNLIGEHTDYNEGFVFPMALEQRVIVAVAPRNDRTVRLRSENLDDGIAFSLDENERKRDHWSDYTAAVARMLELEGVRLSGADLLIESTVPVGAGLSSSAAVEIASALAFLSTVGKRMDPKGLALLGRRAENEFVGMNCGIMDQFVSVFGEKDHALFLDCRSLHFRHVPLPSEEVGIVICNTMVRHELGASEYNKRRVECEEGVRRFREAMPDVRSLRDVSPEAFVRREGSLPEVVRRRCRHVVTENLRVLETLETLETGDLARFGRMMVQSHESLRDDYEVSCPELDAMVRAALRIPGCLGARMTGGGFGGCTVNLVERDALDSFRSDVAHAYEEATGVRPEIYISIPSRGAHEIEEG